MDHPALATEIGLELGDLNLILDSLTEYAERNLPESKLLQLDHDDEFPEDIVREMFGELGIQLVFIPERFDGMGGGSFDVYRVCEALARIDLGIATGVLATFLGSDPIVFGGTEDQKALWLGQIANDGYLMAYAATEAQAGSDLAALKTKAVPVVDDGLTTGYHISGSKQWISNGAYANLYSVLAATPGGPTWFIVARDSEGLTAGGPEDKHGIRASNTSTVSLENVYVPASSLVGGREGQGLIQAQAVFGYTRLMVAAFGLGAGWEALDRAIRYSTQRIQAGTPLSEKPGYTYKLIVPHAVRLEASRAFIEQTASRLDAGENRLNTEGAIAKYLASEAGNDAADAAIQALGGYGYTREYMVEKIKRDVRITTIYEGTSEIMEITIGRDRWQEHLKTRGRYYHDRSDTVRKLHDAFPFAGLRIVADLYRALAEIFEEARTRRLTRNQHIQMRMGEWVALAEGAESLARKAVAAKQDMLHPKADRRYDAETMAAMSRIFAREAALKIGMEGMRWTGGAGLSTADLKSYESRLDLFALYAAQNGIIEDHETVVQALYRGY